MGGMKKTNPNPPPRKSFKALDAAFELISMLVPVVSAVGKHDKNLKSQLQRAASSIPLNLTKAGASRTATSASATSRRSGPPERSLRF